MLNYVVLSSDKKVKKFSSRSKAIKYMDNKKRVNPDITYTFNKVINYINNTIII